MPDGFLERLIVFTRYPEPGTTKTRMIPKLGAEGAAELQRQMTEHVISTVRQLADRRQLPIEVRFDGGSKKLMQQWLGHDFSYRLQGEGDIGRRMQRAFAEGFQDGYEPIVIIGSDIPGITTDILQRAFDGLQNKDLVLGPANDGGYYLIGMRRDAFNRNAPRIFASVSWSTDKVLSQTLNLARNLGLSSLLTDTLSDVDRPEDLALWQEVSKAISDSSKVISISVIIPTLNEAETIHATLCVLQKKSNLEMIVVDGGSQDNTVELAASVGAKVLITSPSKAVQMNTGAAAASGDILLFLHADTRLPVNFERHILSAAHQNGFCAGAFRLSIDSNLSALRLIEQVANWRSRFLGMPYGDQGLFISRALFRKIGGFAEIPIMEDVELIRRLRQKSKITILNQSVKTSSRRWLNLGILRTWLLNQIILLGFYTGISPTRLAKWYRREKGKYG
ncbi:MAG: TIGR04283 family arsenosugar biosynthesis glycosyltransferase [Desulfobacterales bacterium]|jgi:hypothetical protein